MNFYCKSGPGTHLLRGLSEEDASNVSEQL